MMPILLYCVARHQCLTLMIDRPSPDHFLGSQNLTSEHLQLRQLLFELDQ